MGCGDSSKNVSPFPWFWVFQTNGVVFLCLKCLKACLKRAWKKIGEIGTKTVVQARLFQTQ